MKYYFLSLLLVSGFLSETPVHSEPSKGLPSKAVTVSGTLVDAYCYMREGDLTNTHINLKNCGTECLKDGLPAGILVNGKLYVLIFPGTVFADYLYQPVEVFGELYGESDIIPLKVTVTLNGKKKNIKLAGKVMM